MSGGVAYLLDADHGRINTEMVAIENLDAGDLGRIAHQIPVVGIRPVRNLDRGQAVRATDTHNVAGVVGALRIIRSLGQFPGSTHQIDRVQQVLGQQAQPLRRLIGHLHNDLHSIDQVVAGQSGSHPVALVVGRIEHLVRIRQSRAITRVGREQGAHVLVDGDGGRLGQQRGDLPNTAQVIIDDGPPPDSHHIAVLGRRVVLSGLVPVEFGVLSAIRGALSQRTEVVQPNAILLLHVAQRGLGHDGFPPPLLAVVGSH